MNSSFYGGHEGRPLILKGSFKTVKEMVDAFGDPTSKIIEFGEYAIIASDNRNNPENGRIYRRGKDYANITGTKITAWKEENGVFVVDETVTTANGAEYVSQIVGPGGDAPFLHLVKINDKNLQIPQGDDDVNKQYGSGSFSTANNNLVSGKTKNTIDWKYCSIRNEQNNTTNAYIGFTVPYTVIETKVTTVSPYTEASITEDASSEKKPFYYLWNVEIPKGIKGDSFNNLEIVNNDGKQQLQYTTINYDKNADGTVAEPIILKNYKWATNIKLNSSTGKVTTEYSDGTSKTTQNPTMDWIKSATLDENKVLKIDYVNTEDMSINLKTPNSLIYENGSFYVTYNTDPTKKVGIGGIDDAAIGVLAVSKEETIDTTLRIGGLAFITEEN